MPNKPDARDGLQPRVIRSVRRMETMMELQEFITQSITQIVNGVKKAQEQNTTDARVNPSDLSLGDGVAHKELYDFEHHMLLTRVEFDGTPQNSGHTERPSCIRL